MNQQFSKKKQGKSTNMFHTPQTHGELITIPMTSSMHFLSLFSLLFQFVLTVFSIYAFRTQSEIAVLSNSGFSSNIIYLMFPLITWILSFGFRFSCRAIPLDMWRLPVQVREGMKRSQGTPLKLMTLLIELETVICLLYICITLYLGYEPSNIILVIWIIILVISIYLPGKKASDLAK